MPIELQEIDKDESGDGGEPDGSSEEQQQLAAEKLDAELRGSLGLPDDAGDAGGGEPKTAEGDSADKRSDAEKPEDEPKLDDTAAKKGDRKGWRYKGLRLKEQQLARQQAELHAGYQTLAQQQQAAKEYQEAAERIRQLAITSPRAAAREFARLTGQSAEDLYQGWTEERLRGGTEPEHDKLSQVPPAVRQLLDQQAAELKALKEGQEKFTTAAQQQAAAAAHQADCEQVLRVAAAEDEEKVNAHPYLATMPAAYRDTFVSQGVAMALELQRSDGTPRTHGWLAKQLDDVRMRELRDQLQALPASALQAILPAGLKVVKGGTSQDGAHPAGGANGRDHGSKRGGKRGLGNRAGAQTSTGARPGMSTTEYEQQLDERLRASLLRASLRDG